MIPVTIQLLVDKLGKKHSIMIMKVDDGNFRKVATVSDNIHSNLQSCNYSTKAEFEKLILNTYKEQGISNEVEFKYLDF